MSTVYNRRRGAAANKPRPAMQCAGIIDGVTHIDRCTRLASKGRFCSDCHPPRAVEGPIGRAFRLAHQRNQSIEAARLAGKESLRLNAWRKKQWEKVRAAEALAAFVQGLAAGVVTTAKKVARRMNPWAH